ncbi:MAG TPA: hypothetical protein VNZ43_11235 [Sphingomonadaceae bacterium]|nr:hypothetical protein [Sphingomonadaceae bacterium]
MADSYSSSAEALHSPASRAVAVTADDDAPLPDIPKALYIGTGGDIVLRGLRDAADATWRNVPSGSVLPFRAQFVRATGTTAADILALY